MLPEIIKNSIKRIEKRIKDTTAAKDKTGLIKAACLFLLYLIAFITPGVIGEVMSVVSMNKKELPIYCVDTPEKKLALTFDAAWGNEDTVKIIDILERNNVKVTFFATGGWVEKYPEDVKAIVNAGHVIGNHSENHKYMTKLSETQQKEEIMKVHEKVKKLTGYDMCVFRPPYGDYNDSVIRSADACGYYTIQWSVDSLDWKDYGVDSIIEKVTKHKALENGAIILMHNGAKYTADALESVIIELKKQGYSFVTVPELIYTDNFHIDHTGKQIAD